MRKFIEKIKQIKTNYLFKKEKKNRISKILSFIKKYNKKKDLEVVFDIRSYKNVKHNVKVSNDITYFNKYLSEINNEISLRKIINLGFDGTRFIKNILVERINSYESSIHNFKGFKALVEFNKLIKLYKKSVYQFDIKNDVKFEILKIKWRFAGFLFKKLSFSLINDVENLLDSLQKDVENYLISYVLDSAKIYQEITTELVDLYTSAYIKNKKENPNKFDKLLDKIYHKIFKLKPQVANEKMRFVDLFKKENFNKATLKTYFFGNEERRGIISSIIIYVLLILFGFVYIYPILYMLGYSFMSSSDLANPNVNYVPTYLEKSNYQEALVVLDYWSTLGETILISVLPSICQTISCSLIAWGLARYKFKGSKILFGLIIFTFLIPSCLTMLPTVSLFAKLKITGTIFAYVLPALFGQGLKSAVFILIFYQYFKAIPKAIIEASEIDGANAIVSYFKIGLASAKSAILLTILLSIVWYYNETVLASAFFGSTIHTLPLGLENFKSSFDSIYADASTGKSINEATYMAGTMLNIIPLLLLYFVTQKYFIQGVDKSGITGE